MLQLWACDVCGVSNEVIVSLLAPPPDSIVRECRECGHAQEIRIHERDPELAARQRRRKVESFVKVAALTG